MKTYNNKWIKAEEGPEKNSVVYTDKDGNQLIRFWKAYEGQPATEASTRSLKVHGLPKKKQLLLLKQESLLQRCPYKGRAIFTSKNTPAII